MPALIIVAILAALTGPTSLQQTPGTGTQSTAEKPWPPAGVARMGRGVVSPEVVKEVKPEYTPEARKEGIAGGMEMEAIVEADGTVGEVRVIRSLDRQFGLDDEAVKALKKWRFKPGKKDGVAVPVLVAVEMTFNLRK